MRSYRWIQRACRVAVGLRSYRNSPSRFTPFCMADTQHFLSLGDITKRYYDIIIFYVVCLTTNKQSPNAN